MKRIYFVRHGETEANRTQTLTGKDEPLNAHGFSQAAVVAERLQHLSIDAVIASDYQRAQQTAEPIAQILKLHVETSHLFGEYFEPTSLRGLVEHDEKVSLFREQRNQNMSIEDWSFEDGETFFSFHKRITEAIRFLEKRDEENIVVVAHCFFLKFLVATILVDAKTPNEDWYQVGKKVQISNTSVSLLSHDLSQGWQAVMINDHAHFAE